MVAERAEHRVERVDEDDARLAGIDVLVLPRQVPVGQLGDLPGHLDAGRARAHDDERHPALDLLRVGLQVRQLERAEDPGAQFERVVDALHAGREVGVLVVAEVRLRRARGDDQGVVLDGVVEAGRVGGDRTRLDVDAGDRAEPYVDVALAAQYLPDRRRDLALGQDAGRHLVEQRLEQVIRRAVDQGDLHRGPAQRLGGEQPAESRADDDYAVRAISGSWHQRLRMWWPFSCP